MGETQLRRLIRARQAEVRRHVASEIRRALDARGVSLRALGEAIGVDPSHLSRVLADHRAISLDALVAVATGLGFDVSMRLFESTGAGLRDRLQAPMFEAMLRDAHPRWGPRLEVAVYRPARGVIDLVLQDARSCDVVAAEGHSRLRSVEEQLRWAGQKADSLPSARGWPWGEPECEPRVGRLLLLRSCAENHALVRSLPTVFGAAYPDSTEAAVAALRGEARWPGAAIVWVRVDGAATRLLDGVPRQARASFVSYARAPASARRVVR